MVEKALGKPKRELLFMNQMINRPIQIKFKKKAENYLSAI